MLSPAQTDGRSQSLSKSAEVLAKRHCVRAVELILILILILPLPPSPPLLLLLLLSMLIPILIMILIRVRLSGPRHNGLIDCDRYWRRSVLPAANGNGLSNAASRGSAAWEQQLSDCLCPANGPAANCCERAPQCSCLFVLQHS